ncbi:ABC transporter ATP-binding protein [Saccharothrix coeruleofusca]|uniref:ABC transporter n=1 Tax=Saccharothrix coeruleofusca TaxID=33919 RepID=A0A918EHR6_9PSEU|nr:ABC transporter ATP-binding protein [Saccharothrix coeruleofusca]GGP79840.1 ABC transporter [Saccharothrix coeruleofusca]
MEPDTATRPMTSALSLRHWLAPHRGLLAVVLVLELGARAAALMQPLAAREIVDGVASDADLTGPIAVLGGVALTGLCLNYLGYYQRGKLSERFVLGIRRAMARRIIGAPVSRVEAHSTGDVLSRVGADTTLVQQTTVKALVDLVVVPLTVASGIVLVLLIDLFLGTIVITLLTAATLAEARVFRRVALDTEHAQEHVGAMTSVVQRILLAFRTVKASRTEQAETASFDRHADAAYRANVRAARTGALADTVAYAAVDFTFLVILAIGVLRVSADAIGVGDLVAILLYVVYIQEPVESLTGSASRLSEGLAALRRITGLLRLPQEAEALRVVESRPRVPVVADVPRSVRLDAVSFGYEDRPVLREVSISAPVGVTVLVGSSGAGKTTLLSLVERFVEPDRGRILLDGVDIRDLPLSELRARISYVQQEAPLLGATVREAAAYGTTGVSEQRLEQVLESVGLAEWVSGLPDGLDTEVGERGVGISGGQRQRLAVARALARDSEVLLLDEATSQLDPFNERLLVKSLTRQYRDRIIIAVTHRMQLAHEADQVVMLRGGAVHARGRHDQLLTDPAYRELVASPEPTIHNGQMR